MGGNVEGLLFADDFVGINESEEQLQRLIHWYIHTAKNGN